MNGLTPTRSARIGAARVGIGGPVGSGKTAMDVASHEAAWRAACHDFVLTDNKGKENYLTCSFENGDAATANISPQGIACSPDARAFDRGTCRCCPDD